jgi:hypothetical protein
VILTKSVAAEPRWTLWVKITGWQAIDGATVGLAHVIGLGSSCGVPILEKSAA